MVILVVSEENFEAREAPSLKKFIVMTSNEFWTAYFKDFIIFNLLFYTS